MKLTKTNSVIQRKPNGRFLLVVDGQKIPFVKNTEESQFTAKGWRKRVRIETNSKGSYCYFPWEEQYEVLPY